MLALYFLGAVVVLILNYVIAIQFSDIAEMKGHNGTKYFWFTFIFGVVGMLMVVALPTVTVNRENKTSVSHTPVGSADVLKKAASKAPSSPAKRCPYCGDVVKSGRCEMCGKEVK